MPSSRVGIHRAVPSLLVIVTGLTLVASDPGAAADVPGRHPAPAQCAPCSDPEDCTSSGLRARPAPDCAAPPDTTAASSAPPGPGLDKAVVAARAGFDAFLAGVDLPEPGDDYEELGECPVATPEEFQAALAQLGSSEVFSPPTASLGVESSEDAGTTLEFPVLVCESRVPSEVRDTPEAALGIIRLPEGSDFMDTLGGEGAGLAIEIQEASADTFGVPIMSICLPERTCFAVWETSGFVAALAINPSTVDLVGGRPPMAAALETLLEPVLAAVADLPVGAPAKP